MTAASLSHNEKYQKLQVQVTLVIIVEEKLTNLM